MLTSRTFLCRAPRAQTLIAPVSGGAAMHEGLPSRTAWRVALRRAAHQVLDKPIVFEDPLALAIVGGEPARRLLRRPAEEGHERIAMHLRAFMAARSRLAEDELTAAVGRGVTQYVVLGAGLDTFAYRNPFTDALRVFEVDFPATQRWKRAELRRARIDVPAWLSFVPVDFDRQSAFDELAAAGFDRTRPAFFSWLGVTMYLSPAVVYSVLSAIAAMPSGGGVVFDYAVDPSLLGSIERRVFEEFSRRVAATGEPWTGLFNPETLAAQLRDAGFVSISDLGADAINAQLFAGREDGLRVGTLARLVTALN